MIPEYPRIAVIGGAGRLATAITDKYPSEVLSIVRRQEHVDEQMELADLGVTPILMDISRCSVDELAEAIDDVDAVIFAAVSREGDRFSTYTTDLLGALRAQQACLQAEVRRFIQLSDLGCEHPPTEDTDPRWAYAESKFIADEALRVSGLDYTIIKPAMMSSQAEHGLRIEGNVTTRVPVQIEDVAQLIIEIISDERTYGADLNVMNGTDSAAAALDGYLDSPEGAFAQAPSGAAAALWL